MQHDWNATTSTVRLAFDNSFRITVLRFTNRSMRSVIDTVF